MENSSKKILFSLLFSLVLLSSFASANIFSDILSSFGLGAFVNGENVPSGYAYKSDYIATLTYAGECEGINSNAYQYKVFKVYTFGSSTPLQTGMVSPSTTHQFCASTNDADKKALPYKILIKTYEKAVVNEHSTKVYRLDSQNTNTYVFWMSTDKVQYPEYWCADSTKNRYVDFSANNQKSVCQSSAPSVSIYTGAECFKKGGSQFKDCKSEEEYGLTYSKLFDIEGSDLDCCKPTFTNYYGGDIDNGQVFKDDSVASGLGYLGGAVVSGTGAVLGDASAKFVESFIKSLSSTTAGKIILAVISLVLAVVLLTLYFKWLHPLIRRLF